MWVREFEMFSKIFFMIYVEYMYHVVYEGGGEADYWKHELAMITCRCSIQSNDCDSDTDLSGL